MNSIKFLKYLNPLSVFDTKRTRTIFKVNPTVVPERVEATETKVTIFDYTPASFQEVQLNQVTDSFPFKENNNVSWINVDGIRKVEVEAIAAHFGIHYLIVEDIMSVSQRPKMDEIENVLFCLLNMLYFNEQTGTVETEQISIVLGENFIVSIQEDARRDVFNSIREKLRLSHTKLRLSGADYLCYAMLDMIVDHYFIVMEKLGDRIEMLEEKIIRNSNTRSLAEINSLRKELIVLKRNVSPVRDLMNGFIRSDSDLLEENTTKYFKDILDHITQANELAESYRDMMMNLQDLYLSHVNLKSNAVMKVMAVVTCLLAPATVIGGIFGMNFDIIPFLNDQYGFYIALGLMIIIPTWMVVVFKRRGWF
jgi:magnesium transporter